MTRAKCIFCGGKATLLCDSYIGWERKRGEMRRDGHDGLMAGPGYVVPRRYRLNHTCDAPLCQACAVPAGSFHVRLRYHGSFSESIDYCPGHHFGDMRPEITGLQAQALRARWRSTVRAANQQAEPKQAGLFTELLQ